MISSNTAVYPKLGKKPSALKMARHGSSRRNSADANPELANPDHMYFDQDGVLRVGQRRRSRQDELQYITTAMEAPNGEGVKYVVDERWLKNWRAFAQLTHSTPAPEPVDNKHLLRWDIPTGRWVPKDGTQCAGEGKEGNFRLVSPETWKRLVELYPGSGPQISVSEPPFTNPTSWVIEQRPAPEVVREAMELQNGTVARHNSDLSSWTYRSGDAENGGNMPANGASTHSQGRTAVEYPETAVVV